MVDPSTEYIKVQYTTTRPSFRSEDIRTRRLDLKEVCGALEKKTGGKKASEKLKAIAQGKWAGQTHLIVDYKAEDFGRHWKSFNSQYIISHANEKIAKLINEVCTKQLNTQPSIIIIPSKDFVHIQHPVATPKSKTGSYIIHKGVQTQELLSALEQIPHAHEAFKKGVCLNSDEASLSVEDELSKAMSHLELDGMRWSHQDISMKLVEMDQKESKMVREAFFQQVGSLPQLPVYIGHKIKGLAH